MSDRRILLIVLGVNLLLGLLLFDPKLSTGGDNAQYMILAKSILKGRYADLQAPSAPAHTQYPPVLPLLLAPVLALSGGSFVPAKFLILACCVFGVYFGYLLLRRLLPDRDWVVPLLLLAFCPLYLQYGHDTYTEVPFILLSLVALVCLNRGVDARPARLGWIALAGLFAALAMLTRMMGVALPLAIAVWLLAKRRWREFGVFAGVGLVLVVPWFVRTFSLPQTGGYFEQLLRKEWYIENSGNIGFGDMVKRVFENLRIYLFQAYPSILVPALDKVGGAVTGIVGALLSLLTVVGVVSETRRRGFRALELYVILAFGILMIWPSVWSGDRFLLPIVPLLIVYLVAGLRALGQRIRFSALVPVSAVLLVTLFGIVNAQAAQKNMASLSGYLRGDRFAGYDEAWRTYFESCLWLRDHTDPDAIVATRKPQFTYLLSGRRSFVYPYTVDAGRVLASLDSLGATHAFLETFFGQPVKYFYPVVRDNPDRFEQMAALGSREAPVYVFRVRR